MICTQINTSPRSRVRFVLRECFFMQRPSLLARRPAAPRSREPSTDKETWHKRHGASKRNAGTPRCAQQYAMSCLLMPGTTSPADSIFSGQGSRDGLSPPFTLNCCVVCLECKRVTQSPASMARVFRQSIRAQPNPVTQVRASRSNRATSSMGRRKPHLRKLTPRSSENAKRRLRDPHPEHGWLQELADRASYDPHPKHKMRPLAFGLRPLTGPRTDATYCDAHADFEPSDILRVPGLLQRGILAGLVGANDLNGEPTLVWTVDDTGWIYEGRITITGRAVYHGYPVLPDEAIARAVIGRYISFVLNQHDPILDLSLQRLQERYS